MLYYYFKIDMAEIKYNVVIEYAAKVMGQIKKSFQDNQIIKSNPIAKLIVINCKYNEKSNKIDGICIAGNQFFLNQCPSKYIKEEINYFVKDEIIKFIISVSGIDISRIEFLKMFDITLVCEEVSKDILNEMMSDAFTNQTINRLMIEFGTNYEVQDALRRTKSGSFITTKMLDNYFNIVRKKTVIERNRVLFYNTADNNFISGVSDVIYKYSTFGIGYNLVDLTESDHCLDAMPASIVFNIDESYGENKTKYNMMNVLNKINMIPFAQMIIVFNSENKRSFYLMKKLYQEAEKFIGYKPKIATSLGLEYYKPSEKENMIKPIPVKDIGKFARINIKRLGINVSEKDLKSIEKYLKFIRRPDKSFPAVKQLHPTDVGNVVSRFVFGAKDISSEINKAIANFKSKTEEESNTLTETELVRTDINNVAKPNLIGMDDIKQNINSIAFKLQLDANRKKNGKETYSYTNNFCFLGNPGCGKTEMARYLYKTLKEKKVITGKYLELGRSDIVMEYVGHTGKRVQELLEQSKGGMFFLDEAYSLVDDVFAEEALTTILQGMETYKNTIFVFAGYKDEMKKFIKSNPGFRSRITYDITFPDYTDEQLIDIFKNMCNKKDIAYNDKVIKKVNSSIKASRSKDFGNARYVRNLVDKAVNSACSRMIREGVNPSKICRITLKEEDIPTKSKPKVKLGFSM